MADTTYQHIWKGLLLLCPTLPLPLAQDMTNRAYRKALDSYRWSALRGESEIVIPAAYSTGTVSVTQNSTTITGSGTTWTSAMVGRQFFVGGKSPYYTIATFTSTTSLELDRVYGGSTASDQTYAIQLVYVTPATDFLHFTSIRDVDNGWKLRFDVNQEWLDKRDPQRTSAGTPFLFSAAAYSSSPPKYEVWPRPSTDGKTYPYRYIKRIADLSADGDMPIFPIRAAGIREGAIAELCLWPGLSDAPNPYFRPDLHAAHTRRFEDALQQYAREDQEINLTDVSSPEDQASYPPLDASFWQSHALPAF